MLAEITLTKRHYSRMRQYWQAGSTGLSSACDGIVLDLTAGYLEMKSSGGGLRLSITDKGELEREKERRRPHYDLTARLSIWLREQGRITCENIGPSWISASPPAN